MVFAARVSFRKRLADWAAMKDAERFSNDDLETRLTDVQRVLKGVDVKKRAIVGILLLVIGAACSSLGSAYDAWYAAPRVGVGYGGGAYGGYGGYGYGGLGGAQTPYSAAATGMGNLVRSEGQYNEATAAARVENEKARSQYIDNEQKVLDYRQTQKRAAQARDAQELTATLDARTRQDAFLATQRPPALSSDELNPSTGAIQWPDVLQQPSYAELRNSLNGLFEKQAKSGPTADLSTNIRLKVGQLKDSLRGHITEMPMSQYSECRKFLDRMSSTVQ